MSHLAFAVCVLAVVGCGFGLISGSAVAGDNVALFDFDPQEANVSAGETVTVNATMYSHGGYGGQGVSAVSMTVVYDPEIVALVDVERGPWLSSDGADVSASTAVDNDEGRATIEQTRETDNGTVNSGSVVQLTFEVREGAPPSDAYLQYEDGEVLLDNDVPQSTMFREGVFYVDGGGPERVPLAETNGENGTDGVTIAEDENRDTDTGASTPSEARTTAHDDSSTDADGAGFGFGLGILAALVAGVAPVLVRRHTE